MSLFQRETFESLKYAAAWANEFPGKCLLQIYLKLAYG